MRRAMTGREERLDATPSPDCGKGLPAQRWEAPSAVGSASRSRGEPHLCIGWTVRARVLRGIRMFDVGDWDEDEPTTSTAAATPPANDAADLEELLRAAEISSMQQPKPAKQQARTPRHAQPAGAAAPAGVPSAPPIELGYVSPYPWSPAQPDHFPSKVGGEPVWLLPNRLPSAEAMRCGCCGRSLRFLMQLYCPRPEVEHAYHRSVMLFCCGGACLQRAGGWRALRANLPQSTPHYVENDDGSFTTHGFERLLSTSSPSEGGAKMTAAAANAGGGAATGAAGAPAVPPPALPELLVSVWLEGDWESQVAYDDEEMRAEAHRLLAAYEASEGPEWMHAQGDCSGDYTPRASSVASSSRSVAKSGVTPGVKSACGADGSGGGGGGGASSAAATDDEDDGDDEDDEMEAENSFFAFQRRTSANPEQALRYSRDPKGAPLWAGPQGQPPPGAPPPCERCGAARTFEFQLMPQLLCAIESAMPESTAAVPAVPPGGAMGGSNPAGAAAVLGDENDIDFGVVAVYTCSASCAATDDPALSAYANEWCWHQPLM